MAQERVQNDRTRVSKNKPKSKSTKKINIVEVANALDIVTFSRQYIDSTRLQYRLNEQSPRFIIEIKPAMDLLPSELQACYKLIEATSRPDYEASTRGWRPRSKKREMQQAEMRYLLVRPISEQDETGQMAADTEIQGFMSVMITHDSVPCVPVLYVYEIHLSEPLRGSGLGAHLMQLAEDVARRVGVEKVMLTCFLSNQKAHAFYQKLGYATDACSPEERQTRMQVVKPDYVIMSKAVER